MPVALYDKHRPFNIHNITINYHISQAFYLSFFAFLGKAHNELLGRAINPNNIV